MKPSFDTVLIVGVGQIGASLGKNLVARKVSANVIGVGRDRGNLKQALSRKCVHRTAGAEDFADLAKRLTDRSLIVLATPVASIRDYLRRIGSLSARPLVVDVGSTKSKILLAAEKYRVRFVGAHPIAGTEKGGAAGSDAALFRGKTCLVTPSRFSARADVKSIEALWKLCGAKTAVMDATRHDRLFAAVSHLPHVLAFTLTTLASSKSFFPAGLRRDMLPGLGSLKSATRVAASPVEMWVEIFGENEAEIGRALGVYLKELKAFSKMFRKPDALRRYLAKAQKERRSYPL